MDKKGIVITCGLIAVVAVAGGTLKSVLAADEPEVGSAVHTGIAGEYIRDEGITKGESLGMLIRVYEDLAKTNGYLTDVSRGESIGEVIGNTDSDVGVRKEVDADAMGDLLADLNSLIDPDLHVDFANLENLVIDDEMTEALKQTNVYKDYELLGTSEWYIDIWEDCFNKNLNTLLSAYNSGDITKEDYYRWCNDLKWPDALQWQDELQNATDRIAVSKGGRTNTSDINPTVPGNEHLASNPSSGNTGNGGGSGAVNQGSGAGGGASVVQTPEQPPVDPGASNGGYYTVDWQDPAATETWGGQPATEESIAELFGSFGATSQTDAEAAASGAAGKAELDSGKYDGVVIR